MTQQYKWEDTGITLKAKVFWIGLRDGLDTPYDMGVGMDYDDPYLQFAWDWGANIGQFIGSFGRTRMWKGEED